MLVQILRKEMDAGLFNYKIQGITVYKLVRRTLIENYGRSIGLNVMAPRQSFEKKTAVVNTISSLWQLLKLRLSGKTASTVFISFPRIDKVGAYYLDKFVDPLVSSCFEDSGDYIILDQGRGGYHAKPRLHQDHCIQTEWYIVDGSLYAKLFHKKFYKSNKECLDALYESLVSVFGASCPNKKVLLVLICTYFRRVYCYEKLFRRMKVKRILGPARDFLRAGIIAAHRVGIASFELQHGITYGETLMYSGFHPNETMPDYFLAFGDNDPIDVYGIEPERIVNIGWALNDYMASNKDFIQYNTQDVLVISEPKITDNIISLTLLLAKDNPQSHFYVRPHPHEEISESQKSRLESLPNAHWQDKRINIAMVMQGFTHVVGENSTVLYEALAAGKKVGKLYYEGLRPRYLKEDDRNCFWEIKDQESFARFIQEDISTKNTKSIYSPFNKALFLQTIGMNNNNI